MFKMLLASTALATLVTTTAFAANETAPANADTAVTTETGTTAAADADVNEAKAAAERTDNTLASNLIGSAVYASAAEDAEMIGDVNDIVISPEGEVASVIVGVGGFLGIGEKDVAVKYDTIEWVERNNNRWLVANMNREQLEAAPAFDRTALYPENNAADATDEGVTTMTDGAMTEQPTAAEETANNVENGASAVADAEQKTEQTMGIDRTAMTPVTTEELTADNLTGQTVYGANDENIGEVGDVLLTADNQVEGFILDVGGFLGIGEKEVAISPENLEIMADADGELVVFTPFTQEQLEAQPEYSEEAWEAERDSVIMVVPAG